MQKICIIIPCYNEEKRFAFNEFISFYNRNNTIDFCFVNDGSKDNTIQLLNNIHNGRENRITVVNLPKNVGKAEAVRQGILHSLNCNSFEYVGYFDADFSTPLEEIKSLISSNLDQKKYKLIIGSRIKRMGSEVIRSPRRHYLGRIFSTFASIVLKLPVYDTQCGAKLIEVELAKQIFTKAFITKWLFDVEIIARIINLYGNKHSQQIIYETPLNQWIEKGGSKLNFTYFFKAPYFLIKIYFKYRLYNRN